MKKILLLFLFTISSLSVIYAQCGTTGGIIINEIHYNPDTDDGEFEFIELLNTSDQTISIAGWTLSDGEFTFTFPATTEMAPGDLIVIENGVVMNYPGSIGTFTGSTNAGQLSNGGETVTLSTDGGATVNSVTYNDTNAWDSGTGLCDPTGDSDGGGESIQVIDPCADNTVPGNWAACEPTPNITNALPVDLVSFTVKSITEQSVALSWITASELNNSHFNIEYSIDGINFRAIDEVIGNGTTQLKQEYSYTHTSPIKGNNYYRLKQVDFDGAFEYSDIVVVNIDRAGKIIINPSAAIAEITVQLAETAGANNQIGIYDMMGRTVLMSNFDGTLNEKTLDISSLQKGYYVVRVQAGNEVFTKRFMKMVD